MSDFLVIIITNSMNKSSDRLLSLHSLLLDICPILPIILREYGDGMRVFGIFAVILCVSCCHGRREQATK
jgi:hypothetical protein